MAARGYHASVDARCWLSARRKQPTHSVAHVALPRVAYRFVCLFRRRLL